jgi:threonine-phosphate decarboxylase
MIKKESVALQHEIGSITQLKIYSSNCNFFLVQSLFRPACELKELLINEFGILIRDASNFNGLDAYFFRIAVQRPQMNKLLIKGIKQWIKTKNNSM